MEELKVKMAEAMNSDKEFLEVMKELGMINIESVANMSVDLKLVTQFGEIPDFIKFFGFVGSELNEIFKNESFDMLSNSENSSSFISFRIDLLDKPVGTMEFFNKVHRSSINLLNLFNMFHEVSNKRKLEL